MNLFLLLSALLSALSGVGGAVRRAEPAAAVARNVIATASACSVRTTRRPMPGRAVIVDVLAPAWSALVAPFRAGPPLYAQRRRE